VLPPDVLTEVVKYLIYHHNIYKDTLLLFFMKMKPIKISEGNWKKLIKFKYNLGAKSIDEVLTALIKVVNEIKLASELKKEETKKWIS